MTLPLNRMTAEERERLCHAEGFTEAANSSAAATTCAWVRGTRVRTMVRSADQRAGHAPPGWGRRPRRR